MNSLEHGLLNRNLVLRLLAVKNRWVSVKEISSDLKMARSSAYCHLDMLLRQGLVEEKDIYKITGGRGRKIRHYKATSRFE